MCAALRHVDHAEFFSQPFSVGGFSRSRAAKKEEGPHGQRRGCFLPYENFATLKRAQPRLDFHRLERPTAAWVSA